MEDTTTTTTPATTTTSTGSTTHTQNMGQPDPAGNPRTYTQEECNAIAAKEAGRTDRFWLKLLNIGSKDDVQGILDQIKASGILSTRAAQAEKERDEYRDKYEAATRELSGFRNAKTLAGYGVTDADEQEFLSYKIGKLATDKKSFEDAAKEYFEAHPHPRGVSVQLMPQQQGQAAPSALHEKINKQLRGET